jgi:hypothetical protein
MGFCLFEHARVRDFFFAVNSSHVQNIVPQKDMIRDRPACLLEFDFPLKNFTPLVAGEKSAIEFILRESAKIGLMKVEVTMLGGQRQAMPAPLLLNHPDRIALVREMLPDEFEQRGDGSFVTASELFMADGLARHIVERPGVFVARANIGGKTPILRA